MQAARAMTSMGGMDALKKIAALLFYSRGSGHHLSAFHKADKPFAIGQDKFRTRDLDYALV
ncbi:MAG: hypothetical protein Fur0043_01390 [Anaerolineales bacterium]